MPADIPLVGDWDGDGKYTIGINRNSGKLIVTNVLTENPPMVGIAGVPSSIPFQANWRYSKVDSVVYVIGNTWTRNAGASPGVPLQLGEVGSSPLVGIWEIIK